MRPPPQQLPFYAIGEVLGGARGFGAQSEPPCFKPFRGMRAENHTGTQAHTGTHRNTHRHTDRHSQTQTQTETQAHRHAQTHLGTRTQAHRHAQAHTHREKHRQRHRQTHACRHTLGVCLCLCSWRFVRGVLKKTQKSQSSGHPK